MRHDLIYFKRRFHPVRLEDGSACFASSLMPTSGITTACGRKSLKILFPAAMFARRRAAINSEASPTGRYWRGQFNLRTARKNRAYVVREV